MNKKTKIFLFRSLLVYSLSYQLVSAQTLQEAVQQTVNENPEIQSARSNRSAVNYEIDQAKSEYLPKLDLTAGIGWDTTIRDQKKHSEEASLRLTQMIFDGLATPNEVNRQSARANSRAYSVLRQSEISALQAVDAYLGVLKSQELLSLAKENLAVHTKTNDQIQLRANSGIGKKAEASQSNGRLALAEKNTLSEVGNFKDAATNYQHIIGSLPYKLELPIAPTGALPKSLKQALQLAISNHPTLKSANADIASAFSQHETAKAAYMPRLDFEAGITHENNRDDSYAMLRMRYNLFNGGKDQARRYQTSEQVNEAKEIRDLTYRQVIESMRLSWTAYQTIKRQLTFLKIHKDSSIASNNAYQKQFNIGQRTLLDLLDSANEMFTTKSAYTTAKYDVLYSQFRILTSKGDLTHYLGITLPSETKISTDTTSEDITNQVDGHLIPLKEKIVSNTEEAEVKTYTNRCYNLSPQDNIQAMQAIADKEFYQLVFIDEPEYHVSSYLLLTPAMEFIQDTFKLEHQLKQQGFTELWVFREGEFKGQISLGSFQIKENAINALEDYSSKSKLSIELTPRYKTKTRMKVEAKILTEDIAEFETQFAHYIKADDQCIKKITPEIEELDDKKSSPIADYDDSY